MLNQFNERELCYLVTIDSIEPIEGKDRVECARVGGWTIMVRKGQFKPGDLGIYFEIDSKVPETEPFDFLASKHYKIKTQRYKAGDGHFYSQGLLMHPVDFDWKLTTEPSDGIAIVDNYDEAHRVDDESRFLTKTLGVVYAVAEDNKRKAKSVDKYAKMAQRHGELFARAPYRWLMRRDWGKKFLFIFYGKKRDKRGWPEWVSKTDEERVENMTWILSDKAPRIVTEKIDGTSTTFTMKRGKFGHYEFYVCSRNVAFDKPEKKCFYDTNVYTEMAEKYHIEQHLKDILDGYPRFDWVTIQGETYGSGIQKNDYDLKGHKFAAFNLVTSDRGRWGTADMVEFLKLYEVPTVPVLSYYYELPDTVEELREYVHGAQSTINGKIKEGVVIRTQDGQGSFKCVDPDYLAKWHA